MKITEIELKNLPKISLNKWYAGNHWTLRTEIKNNYKIIIKNQFKDVFSSDYSYIVDYAFYFKTRPLDASNCAAMVKLIEDIIFKNDSYKIVEKISISSEKAASDKVIINIKQLTSIKNK